MSDKVDRIRATSAHARTAGEGQLADLLAVVAAAVAATEQGPISTMEQFRWSGVVQRALDIADQRLGKVRNVRTAKPRRPTNNRNEPSGKGGLGIATPWNLPDRRT